MERRSGGGVGGGDRIDEGSGGGTEEIIGSTTTEELRGITDTDWTIETKRRDGGLVEGGGGEQRGWMIGWEIGIEASRSRHGERVGWKRGRWREG